MARLRKAHGGVSPHIAGPAIPVILLMKEHVYKLIELTGTSPTSVEDAVQNAIKRAHKTVKNLSWFQVIETRGNIEKGKVHHWQVTIKIGFAVED